MSGKIDEWEVTFGHLINAQDITIDQNTSKVYFLRSRGPKPHSYGIWAADLNPMGLRSADSIQKNECLLVRDQPKWDLLRVLR